MSKLQVPKNLNRIEDTESPSFDPLLASALVPTKVVATLSLFFYFIVDAVPRWEGAELDSYFWY